MEGVGIEPSEGVLRGLLAAAPDALLAVDGDGAIVFVNDQAEHAFGWRRGELLGQPVECLVPERFSRSHPSLRAGYVAHPSTRAMGAGLQLSARRKDGTTFPADIRLSAVRDEAGALLVLAAVRDVSDRVDREADRKRQALASQRERSHRLDTLGQLAGGVAHDLDELLAVILNYTTLLARQVTDPVAAADLGEIRAAGERAAGLTRQLLAFARQDVARLEALDVNDVVNGMAAMLGPTLGEDIVLDVQLGVGPLVALADRHQLEQIVVNLVLNASDVMPAGGRLTLITQTTPRPGGRSPDVLLRVSDTGQGMSPEVLARAFEPFFTTNPRDQGTGLGLATVYRIVRQNGGEVRIRSTVDVGTTVTVLLRGAEDAAGSGADDALSGTERAAAAGEAVICPVVSGRLLPELRRSHSAIGGDLTDRDREILAFLARGSSNKVIASELHLSVNTVRNYVQSVLVKLDAHSKLEAVSTAVREGVIDYPPTP